MMVRVTPILRLGAVTVPLLLLSCDSLAKAPGLSRTRGTLELGNQVPRVRERDAIGEIEARVERKTPRFRNLTSHFGDEIVFKDEEATGADRIMTRRLKFSIVLRLRSTGTRRKGQGVI